MHNDTGPERHRSLLKVTQSGSGLHLVYRHTDPQPRAAPHRDRTSHKQNRFPDMHTLPLPGGGLHTQCTFHPSRSVPRYKPPGLSYWCDGEVRMWALKPGNTMVKSLISPLKTICVTWSKLLLHSKPQFLDLGNGTTSYIPGLLCGTQTHM